MYLLNTNYAREPDAWNATISATFGANRLLYSNTDHIHSYIHFIYQNVPESAPQTFSPTNALVSN